MLELHEQVEVLKMVAEDAGCGTEELELIDLLLLCETWSCAIGLLHSINDSILKDMGMEPMWTVADEIASFLAYCSEMRSKVVGEISSKMV